MEADAGSLLLLDSESERLYFIAATGCKKEELEKHSLKPGQGIAGHVVMEGKSLVVNDTAGDGRWYRRISESMGVRTQSIACAPLKSNGLTIGVVEFIHNGPGKMFRSEDLAVLAYISELAAIAVDKAFVKDSRPQVGAYKLDAFPKDKLIIGKNPALLDAIAIAEKAAPTDASVLITGESGVGKELMACLVHKRSKRFERPFVSMNCAAIPDTLMESELFGHEKGSFTGASYRGIGKFELADGGTLFLDEIGEMPPNMQKKMLRVLQEGKFYRIGGKSERSVDVRVVSATNKDVVEDVENGVFRKDLYYRLNIVPIHVPPLRERPEDIPEIAGYFLKKLCARMERSEPSITERAMNLFMRHKWPGNVRELRNMIERSLILDTDGVLDADDFQISPREPRIFSFPSISLAYKDAMDSFRKQLVSDALRAANGSRIEAARRLKLQRTYLSRLLKKYDLS